MNLPQQVRQLFGQPASRRADMERWPPLGQTIYVGFGFQRDSPNRLGGEPGFRPTPDDGHGYCLWCISRKQCFQKGQKGLITLGAGPPRVRPINWEYDDSATIFKQKVAGEYWWEFKA